MNEYEARIPSLITEALSEGATIPELERILGPSKAKKYLYDSGLVNMAVPGNEADGSLAGLGGMPTVESALAGAMPGTEQYAAMTDLNPITPNRGIHGINEGFQQNTDFTQNNSRRPNGSTLLEQIMASKQGGGADAAYGKAPDMQGYAGIGKLLGMSNQMARNERIQRQPAGNNMNRYIQSLLGG